MNSLYTSTVCEGGEKIPNEFLVCTWPSLSVVNLNTRSLMYLPISHNRCLRPCRLYLPRLKEVSSSPCKREGGRGENGVNVFSMLSLSFLHRPLVWEREVRVRFDYLGVENGFNSLPSSSWLLSYFIKTTNFYRLTDVLDRFYSNFLGEVSFFLKLFHVSYLFFFFYPSSPPSTFFLPPF